MDQTEELKEMHTIGQTIILLMVVSVTIKIPTVLIFQ